MFPYVCKEQASAAVEEKKKKTKKNFLNFSSSAVQFNFYFRVDKTSFFGAPDGLRVCAKYKGEKKTVKKVISVYLDKQ